jgi:hypothetical protein
MMIPGTSSKLLERVCGNCKLCFFNPFEFFDLCLAKTLYAFEINTIDHCIAQAIHDTCRSPKLCPPLKSTAYRLLSTAKRR